MALVTPRFYVVYMEIKEIIELFTSDLRERMEFEVESIEDNVLTIESLSDIEYSTCILMEMVEDFAGEYSLEVALALPSSGVYTISFTEV